ncbi:MAG: RNA polymerase sigma factor [Solirubrobacteraceae bacterium]
MTVRAGDGSNDGFGALYDRYLDRAYRLALAICRDDGRAQDAGQEAFLSLWRHRTSSVRPRGNVAP